MTLWLLCTSDLASSGCDGEGVDALLVSDGGGAALADTSISWLVVGSTMGTARLRGFCTGGRELDSGSCCVYSICMAKKSKILLSIFKYHPTLGHGV
jgi:hypothetical protein